MKTKFLSVLTLSAWFLVLGSWILVPLTYAKPEHLQIQTPQKKQKHQGGKTMARTVNLSKVEDPEVRNALRAVFDSLDLKDKNA